MQNLVITNAGQELMTSLIAKGTTASFTKIATSEHTYEKEELGNLLALEDIKQEVAISKLEQKDASTIEITVAITNEELTEGYYIKALGLYIKDNEGNEILYAVAIDDTPDHLSAFDNKTISSIKYRLNVRVSNSEQVTLEIDPKVYATAEQVEELSNSVSEISKSLQQVTEITTDLKSHAFNSTVNNLTTTTTGYALDATQGKALNTRVTALETPTFTQATSRTNIASGNTMPTILGKIMKYFTDLKTHAFNTPANNLTTTSEGYALDARQGKALNDKIENKADKMPASAAAHNGIYRGINLLDRYTIKQLHTMVAAGDFSDIYIGDYVEVTISTIYKRDEKVRLLAAHLDYFLGNGSTECTSHHILFVPEDCFATTAGMQTSATGNTTTGGYAGSNMHKTVLPTYYTALNAETALNGHILTHRRYLSSTMTSSTTCGSGLGLSGATTGCTWTDTNLCLMNETMVYGTTAYSSSALDVGDAQAQLALFQLAPHKEIAHLGYSSTSRYGWWLASVASSTYFCVCGGNGNAGYDGANGASGVRPYLLFA